MSTTSEGPSINIQWKGTDACLDFHCTCGASSHFDGYFAKYLRCTACNQIWELSHHVTSTPVDQAEWGTPQEMDLWDEDRCLELCDVPHIPTHEARCILAAGHEGHHRTGRGTSWWVEQR